MRTLAAQGLREGRTASRALGYQQVLAFLDGEISEAEAQERTVSGTRRFARRQDSWFRKDPRITWVAYDDPARVEKALDRDQLSRSSSRGRSRIPNSGENSTGVAARTAPKASIQNTDRSPNW